MWIEVNLSFLLWAKLKYAKDIYKITNRSPDNQNILAQI